MKIKTITRRLGDPDDFDTAVNAALADGWTLKKRYIAEPYEGRSMLFYRMLIAELEKED